MAHFALSYVLRYAGMLEESARECETALSLDSGNYQFRSCAITFEEMGNPEQGTRVSSVRRWFGLGGAEPATLSFKKRQPGRSEGEREEIVRR